MSQAPQWPTTFDQWVQFFDAGRRMTVPVSPSLLERRIRGNRWVTALAAAGLALVLATFVWLVVTGSGRAFTYVITGVLLVLVAFAPLYLRRLRARLAIAEISPNYLELDKDGVVVAGTLEVPWESTVGVLVMDVRKHSQQQARRLGGWLARTAGATQTDVVIGLEIGTAKPFKAAADVRVRILVDAYSDRGSVRIPLDAVLEPDHVASVMLAMTASAYVGERESVLSYDLTEIRTTINKVMRSQPPISGLSVTDEIAAAGAPPADTPPEAPPEPAAPADPGPVASPQPRPTPTLSDLAELVLSEEGRREHAEAANHLATEGPDSFFERYPDYDDGFSEDGPEPVDLLLAVGAEASTVGTCEARYEDSPGHVQRHVILACERLGLATPSFEGISVDDGNDPVAARLREADEALRRVGLRLLLVDPDSDMYFFSAVTGEQFARFVDTSGEGFDLRGVDWIS